MSWHVRGSYFESCNCDPICPCRRIDGMPGGRSTHGECMGVLSWIIEDGAVDEVDLAGLPVAMAIRYSDDEPGSPWTWILYLDAAAADEQRAALEEIFTGGLGGDAETHFPWAWKPSDSLRCGPSPSRSSTRAGASGSGSATGSASAFATATRAHETVTCVIPGHDRSGEELVADELVVEDGPLAFSYRGVCGYGTTFDYSG